MGSEQEVAAGILGMSIAMLGVLAIAFMVLIIIARWKIFTKAGEAGWKSLIPIYADYVQWRIGWKKKGLFWVMFILIFVGYVLVGMSGYPMDGTATTYDPSMGDPTMMGLATIVTLAGLVLALIAAFKLFKSFGHGAGWLILYLFFPYIVLLVLGFGSSRWHGAQD